MTKDQTSVEEKVLLGLGLFSVALGLWEALAPRSVAKAAGVPRSDTLLRFCGARELAAGAGIFGQGAGGPWLHSRIVGDGMDMAILAGALTSKRSNRTRLALAAVAVAGVTALDIYCAAQFSGKDGKRTPKALGTTRITRSVIIDRSPEELYAFWMNHENLVRTMEGVISVQKNSDGRSHWKVAGPAGTTVEWDATVTEARPSQLVSWEAVQGSDVLHRGTLRFDKAPGGRGTLLTVHLEYSAPGGVLAAKLARVFGQAPEQMIATDLRRFKQFIETGEVARTEGQAAGRPSSTSTVYDDLVRK